MVIGLLGLELVYNFRAAENRGQVSKLASLVKNFLPGLAVVLASLRATWLRLAISNERKSNLRSRPPFSRAAENRTRIARTRSVHNAIIPRPVSR